MAKKIHLITQLPSVNARWHEYLDCLQRNLQITYINRVHLVNNFSPIPNSKIHLHIDGPEDLTIGFALKMARNFTQNGDVLIIANADIYFDDAIRFTKLARDPWFLSRSEHYPLQGPLYIGDQCITSNYIGSHDVFVFRMPVPSAWYSVLDWHLGTPGMEARMIWELALFGVIVRNPCRIVPIWHVHYSRKSLQYRFPVVNTFNRSLLAWPTDEFQVLTN